MYHVDYSDDVLTVDTHNKHVALIIVTNVLAMNTDDVLMDVDGICSTLIKVMIY